MPEVQFTVKEQIDRLFPIYWYRKHLDIAARDLLGLDLSPHHALILRDWGKNKPINMVYASRGMGKSILMAIFYVLIAMLYPNLKMIVVGGQGFRGSKMILMECDRIVNGFLSGQKQVRYAKNSLLDPSKPLSKDPAYWSMHFSNGAVIYGIPLAATKDGETIRGLRAHILGQDESFLIPTTLHQAALDPMQNVLYDPTKPEDEQPVKNMSLMVSTCDYTFRDFYLQFDYYRAVLEGEKKSIDIPNADEYLTKDDLSIFEFNIDDSYYLYNNKRVPTWGLDYTRIMKKKNSPTTDIALWESENKNKPLNLQGGYFPFEDVEKGQNIVLNITTEQYPEPLDSCSAPCILGIDTAPTGDNTAFVVVKVGPLDTTMDIEKCKVADIGRKCPHLINKKCGLKKYAQAIYAYEQNEMTQQERVEHIYSLLERYNIIAIAMDSRGGGYELADILSSSDYVKQFVNKSAKPIYDPEKKELKDGMPILTLYSTTQEMNMVFNGFMKSIITNLTLLFPRPMQSRPDNPRLHEISGHMDTLINQIVRIKASPAGRGVTFGIESIDPKTGRKCQGRKDLYSALLYAVGKFRDLYEEAQNKDDEPEEVPLAVAFRM